MTYHRKFLYINHFYIKNSKFRLRPGLVVFNISPISASKFVLKIVLNKHREYMVKLDVLDSEAAIVLSLFLFFGDLKPRCSYKIVLIKKECSASYLSIYRY